MVVDHIGYAVKNIDKAKLPFITLGFDFEEIIEDNDRNIYICFGSNGSYRIELVAPIKGNVSPVDKILKDMGAIPYHLCYKSNNFENDVDELLNNKFLMVVDKAPAVAFAGKRVVFLYNAKIGLLEIVEE